VKTHLDLLLGVASFSLSTTSVLVESSCSTFGKVVISSSARFAIASLYSTSSSSLATYMTLKKKSLAIHINKNMPICHALLHRLLSANYLYKLLTINTWIRIHKNMPI
jgi:hypothetical protein